MVGSLILLLVGSLLLAMDIVPECESGHLCHKCVCMGDYYGNLPEGEEEQNKKHPSKACKNFCSKKCCSCAESAA